MVAPSTVLLRFGRAHHGARTPSPLRANRLVGVRSRSLVSESRWPRCLLRSLAAAEPPEFPHLTSENAEIFGSCRPHVKQEQLSRRVTSYVEY